MPRTCTICSHPKLSEIDAALLGRESFRNIAKRFGASPSAAYRDQQQHLLGAPVEAKDVTAAPQPDTLIGKIIQLGDEARRLGKKAEDSGDLRGALTAVRELVRIVELLGRIQGEISEPGEATTISVVYVDMPGKAATPIVPSASKEIIDLPALKPENPEREANA